MPQDPEGPCLTSLLGQSGARTAWAIIQAIISAKPSFTQYRVPSRAASLSLCLRRSPRLLRDNGNMPIKIANSVAIALLAAVAPSRGNILWEDVCTQDDVKASVSFGGRGGMGL